MCADTASDDGLELARHEAEDPAVSVVENDTSHRGRTIWIRDSFLANEPAECQKLVDQDEL